jgi:hypothetical protein
MNASIIQHEYYNSLKHGLTLILGAPYEYIEGRSQQ